MKSKLWIVLRKELRETLRDKRNLGMLALVYLLYPLMIGLILCCFGTIWDYMVWPVSPTLAALWMVDYLHLMRIDGAWRVVSKHFYREGRPPAHARSTRATALSHL